MTDVVLSDGFRIPKGTHTAFSSIGINFDPEIYPNPNTFDGFRFAKLREQPGNSAYQAPNPLILFLHTLTLGLTTVYHSSPSFVLWH
jgi:cytochrome P450